MRLVEKTKKSLLCSILYVLLQCSPGRSSPSFQLLVMNPGFFMPFCEGISYNFNTQCFIYKFGHLWRFCSVIYDDFVRLFVTILFGHLWRNPAIASNNKQCRGDRSGRPVQSRPSKSHPSKSVPITPVPISSVPPFPPFQYSRPSRTTALRHVFRAIRPVAPTFRGWFHSLVCRRNPVLNKRLTEKVNTKIFVIQVAKL